MGGNKAANRELKELRMCRSLHSLCHLCFKSFRCNLVLFTCLWFAHRLTFSVLCDSVPGVLRSGVEEGVGEVLWVSSAEE